MNIEDRIREERTTEATKKNLMGMEGKLYLIARFLGDEIIQQSSTENYLDDFWNNIDYEEKMPIIDESTSVSHLGYHYDAMKRGYHLEIFTEYNINEIRLYYKNFLCYKESSGRLETYVPHIEWEQAIENLYLECEPKIKKYVKNKKSEEIKSIQILENDTIKKIREKWGNII